jgi:TIR domain
MADMPRRLLAFLSHKYRSAAVNLALYEVLREAVDVRFEVDEGSPETSITRLARMIRRADCFIGMFTLLGEPGQAYEAAELRHQSRYFRLELDLALRARKPALVLVDDRFRRVIPVPDSVREVRFNAQELLGGVPETTAKIVASVEHLATSSPPSRLSEDSRATVGVVWSGPLDKVFDSAQAVAAEEGVKLRPLTTSPAADLAGLADISQCDWVMVDVTAPRTAHYLGVLHGLGVPVLRLAWSREGAATVPAALYGSLQEHYDKELLRWNSKDDLAEKLSHRIQLIERPTTFITEPNQAEWYFRRAGLRSEPLFLSFAREDRKYAEMMYRELCLKFSDVYSYESTLNPFGADWEVELRAQLARAEVGVALVSASFKESAWCLREADELMARRPAVLVYPVLLDGTQVQAFKKLEYRRFQADANTGPSSRSRTPADLAKEIATAVAESAMARERSGKVLDGLLNAEI